MKTQSRPLGFVTLALLAGLAAVVWAEAPTATAFVDPANPDAFAVAGDSGCQVELAEDAAGKPVVSVSCPAGKGYPGARFQPTGGKPWDLSAHAYAEATVRNATDHPLGLLLRVDNEGPWQQSPWSTGRGQVGAGEIGTVRVYFGFNHGHPAYALDASKVVRVLLFLQNPKDDCAFEVLGLSAGGQPGELPEALKKNLKVSPNDGVLFGGPGFQADKQLSAAGVEAKLADEGGTPRLTLTFAADSKERDQGVFIRPAVGTWDLRQFNCADFHLSNTGAKPLTVFCRLENKYASNERNAAVASATLKPGEEQAVRVDFRARPMQLATVKNQQTLLESTDVVGVRVFQAKPYQAGTLVVNRIVAGVATAEPEWLGQRPPVDGDWVQTLNEEFDAGKLNETLWQPHQVYDGPLQSMPCRYSKENLSFEEGQLIIKYEKRRGHQYDREELPTREYTSAVIVSYGKWTQRYGYFEAKVKLPTGRGLWPCFWMMPDRGAEHGLDPEWKRWSTGIDDVGKGMEIDIMEHLTRTGPYRYNVACHWDGYGKDHKSTGTDRAVVKPTKDGWLVAGLLWEPGHLAWYCNGELIAELTDDRVPDVPLYFILNGQMGGWGGNHIVDADLPDLYRIDYVRAWQKKEWLKK